MDMKIPMMIRNCFTLFALVLVSCTSSPIDNSSVESSQLRYREAIAGGTPRGMGQLIYGRQSNYSYGSAGFELRYGDALLATIANGSYTSFFIEPGIYDFTIVNSVRREMTFQLEAVVVSKNGKVYIELDLWTSPEDLFSINIKPTLDYSKLKINAPLKIALYRNGESIVLGDPIPQAKKADLTLIGTDSTDQTSRANDESTMETVAAIPRGTSILSRNVIAVIIGNKDYRRGIGAVDFAFNDAASFRDQLIEGFGIAQKDLWYTENAGLADLISMFGTANDFRKSRLYRDASMREAPIDLIIYYSGHGAPATSGETKGRGYLVPVEADVMAIQHTGYAIDTLLANIETMKHENVIGRTWLALDACFSGQAGDGTYLLKNVSGLSVVSSLPKKVSDDIVLMFASSGEEYASWYPEQKHGLFTFFLLKALRGAADKNVDSSITLSEIDSYLHDRVPLFANGLNGQDQTPQLVFNKEMDGFLKYER